MKVTHVLRVMNGSGHTDVTYDPTDAVAVEEVRAEFDALIKRNFMMFSAPTATEQGQQMRTFDPEVETIIATLPIAGG